MFEYFILLTRWGFNLAILLTMIGGLALSNLRTYRFLWDISRGREFIVETI